MILSTWVSRHVDRQDVQTGQSPLSWSWSWSSSSSSSLLPVPITRGERGARSQTSPNIPVPTISKLRQTPFKLCRPTDHRLVLTRANGRKGTNGLLGPSDCRQAVYYYLVSQPVPGYIYVNRSPGAVDVCPMYGSVLFISSCRCGCASRGWWVRGRIRW
jgi:hypothetical protein